VNRGDKASERTESSTSYPPRATARVPTPLHTTPALTMRRHYVIPLVVIVRAGVVWSGVGTLAVALTMPHIFGGRFRTSRCSATVQSRDAFHALLSPSALGAVLQRCGTLSGGRPGGGSAPLPTSSLTQLGSRCLLRSPCGDARIYRRSHE